jgi:hypothetical protein
LMTNGLEKKFIIPAKTKGVSAIFKYLEDLQVNNDNTTL